MFKQGKTYITNFIIKSEVLVMKTKIDNMHTIFLLKKNVKTDSIKTILGYLPMTVLEILREQKMANISVGQEYKSMKS